MLSGDQKLLKCSDQWGELARGWSLLCCSQIHPLSPMEPREIPKAHWQPAKTEGIVSNTRKVQPRWLCCWNWRTLKKIVQPKQHRWDLLDTSMDIMNLRCCCFCCCFLIKLSSSKTCELCYRQAGRQMKTADDVRDCCCTWVQLRNRQGCTSSTKTAHGDCRNCWDEAESRGTRSHVSLKTLTQTSRLISLMSPLPL